MYLVWTIHAACSKVRPFIVQYIGKSEGLSLLERHYLALLVAAHGTSIRIPRFAGEIECGMGHSFARSACSASLSAFQKQAPLSERPLYRKLGHANLVELFTLNNIHRNLCYVLPMNCHCWRCFLYPSYSTFRQISMYSVHIQCMYTLNNIVHSIHVHSIQRARTSEAYATRLGARLSQRAKSNKWCHAHNSHNKAWPFVFQNGRFWSS